MFIQQVNVPGYCSWIILIQSQVSTIVAEAQYRFPVHDPRDARILDSRIQTILLYN